MIASPASHAASLAAVRHSNTVAGRHIYASRWSEASGVRTHAVVAGAGKPIIFVHGFPSFWYCWARQLEALRDDFRVIALDALGAGATDRPADLKHYRIASLVGWLRDVFDTLCPDERPILVGHDWGAALSFALAQACPDAISGVVGIAAPPYSQFVRLLRCDRDQQARSAYMHELRLIERGRADAVAGPAVRAAYSGLLGGGHIDVAEFDLFDAACGEPGAFMGGCNWYGGNLGTSTSGIVPAPWVSGDAPLAVPALLIWGNADQTFVDTAPDRFLAENQGAQVLRLEGIGHWCMLQASNTVTDAIARFAHGDMAA